MILKSNERSNSSERPVDLNRAFYGTPAKIASPSFNKTQDKSQSSTIDPAACTRISSASSNKRLKFNHKPYEGDGDEMGRIEFKKRHEDMRTEAWIRSQEGGRDSVIKTVSDNQKDDSYKGGDQIKEGVHGSDRWSNYSGDTLPFTISEAGDFNKEFQESDDLIPIPSSPTLPNHITWK